MFTHNIVEQLPKSFTAFPSNPRFQNLTGRRFGKWTVNGFSHRKQNSYWFVTCECGIIKVINARVLLRGNSRSCGCGTAEAFSLKKRTHGHSLNRKPTPEFESFYHAKARCQNPKESNYPRYGGRGIEFRFNSVQEFLDEVGLRPDKFHSIDRINNDGHYEPGNIRWADKSQQARKRHTSHIITANGQSKTTAEWSEDTGIKYFTIARRQSRGWCGECSVSNVSTCIHRVKAKIGRPKKACTSSLSESVTPK